MYNLLKFVIHLEIISGIGINKNAENVSNKPKVETEVRSCGKKEALATYVGTR